MKASRMAERVGFVPADPAHINDLGTFSTAQNARNAQNLSTRYKTGTANLALRLPSLRKLAPADTLSRTIDGVDRPTPGTRSASLWTP